MKNLNLLFAILFAGTTLFAQKSSVTDAALKYKKYNPMGSMEENKKALNGAKADIDLAAVNTETANDPYMHRYRGLIYFGLMEVATMEAAISGAQPDENLIKGYDSIVRQSFNVVLNAGKKNKEDKEAVQNYIRAKSAYVFENALAMFNNHAYSQATQFFIGAHEITNYINEENDIAKQNAILSFGKAIDTLGLQGKYNEANELGNQMLKFTPKNINVIISLINLNLQKNDIEASEKYLNLATEIDSTNKQIFLVLGSSLMEIKQYEKAATAFQKSLKLDPNYSDAIYQYCGMLFNWSIELRNTASDMKIGDPKAKELEKKATVNLTSNIQILEPYIKANPLDTMAIEITWRTFSFLMNDFKKYEYKDMWYMVRDSIMNTKLISDPKNTSLIFHKYHILSDWYKDCITRADEIELDEIKASMISQSEEIKKKTSELLAKYIEKNPTDKTALEIGWKVYYMLEDKTKSSELKKRWEAIK